jgi:hypothetical protein
MASSLNVAVHQGLVYLNARVSPSQEVYWEVPAGRSFVLTDMTVQNKAPGDGPVPATNFTRFAITSPCGSDTFFHVVGNNTLSEHYITGLPIAGTFRFFNLGNSNAPFAEFHMTGYLAD